MTPSSQKKIVEILCRRDGITQDEAQALVDQTIEEIHACHGNYEIAEEIMRCNLGLEMDYILDLFY